MHDALDTLLKVGRIKFSQLSTLQGRALRLALEQPEAWEYRLFAQVLTDEIDRAADLRTDHRFGIVFGTGEQVELERAIGWIRARHNELMRIADGMDSIIHVQLVEALRPAGTPGDVDEIVFAARKLAGAYRHAIEWSKRVRLAHFDDCVAPVADAMAPFPDTIIENLEAWGPEMLRRIDEAIANPDSGSEVLSLTLTLGEIKNFEEYEAALEKAERDCFG